MFLLYRVTVKDFHSQREGFVLRLQTDSTGDRGRIDETDFTRLGRFCS